MTLLALQDVSKRFPDGTRSTVVLDKVSLQVCARESVGVLAAKRAGKTTLLRIMAGLEAPDNGVVLWDGQNMARMKRSERARLLRSGGLALARGNWDAKSSASVLEYVADSIYSEGLTMNEAGSRARHALEDVEAWHLADKPTAQLSLSERVRVGLAHAIAHKPRLLLVDEPAVLPRPEEARELYALLDALRKRLGFALLVASEEIMAVRSAPRVLNLANGRLSSTDSRHKVIQISDHRADARAGGEGGGAAS
jgi:lipoprotein-releasing system ATP-binding protein